MEAGYAASYVLWPLTGCRAYTVVRLPDSREVAPMSGRASPWCDRCDTVARFYGDMSCIGICPECGEWALVDNLRGMVDKQSIPYKRWLVAYQMTKPGRPRNTTPSPAQLMAIRSVCRQHDDVTASCAFDR